MVETQRHLTPTDVVEEARKWLGTPWVPQGNVLGVGASCIGMHIGLSAVFGLGIAAIPEEHIHMLRAMDWHLHTTREYFQEAFTLTGLLYEIAVTTIQPGDTVLFGFGLNPASHAGIISTMGPEECFIHADYQRHVVEVPLAPVKKRLRFAFRPRYEDIAWPAL